MKEDFKELTKNLISSFTPYEGPKDNNQPKGINYLTSGFGRRFDNCSFDNYHITNEKQKFVVEQCKKYVTMDKSKGESLILFGASGTGKNHLIVSILREIRVDFKVARFEYLSEIKRNCQQGSGVWMDAIKSYCNVYLLVLPDLIIRDQGLTDSQKELLFFIIDERYNNYLPIIIGTNLSIKELKKAIDFKDMTRISDRLGSMVKNRVLCFDWESYR